MCVAQTCFIVGYISRYWPRFIDFFQDIVHWWFRFAYTRLWTACTS